MDFVRYSPLLIVAVVYSGAMGPAVQERKSSQAEPSRDARTQLIAEVREKLNDCPAYPYEKPADPLAVLSHADPPWPEDWATLTVGGATTVAKCPQSGLRQIAMPEPTVLEYANSLVMVRFPSFNLLYGASPPQPKKHANHLVGVWSRDFDIPDEVVEAVKVRINKLSTLDVIRQSVTTVAEGVPDASLPLEEVLYRTALVYARPLIGTTRGPDQCRELTRGQNTVLLFGRADLEESWAVTFQVFRSGEPFYDIHLYVPALLGRGEEPAVDRWGPTVAAVARSIIAYGLKSPECRETSQPAHSETPEDQPPPVDVSAGLDLPLRRAGPANADVTRVPPRRVNNAEKDFCGGPLDLSSLIELLDAVEAELLVSGLCEGGQRIDLALAPHRSREGIVELVYQVPGVLRVYRQAFIERGELAFLRGELSDRRFARKSWMQPIPEEEFKRVYDLLPTRISATLSTALSEERRARQRKREMWKEEIRRAP